MEVLDKYHPDYLFKKQVSADECFFGDHPTLAQLGVMFDKRFPPVWMMAHLHDLSEFCGCKEKLSGHALQQCASIISMEFYWLKITELMLFFHRFKSGKYGRFYGSVDPLVIMTALRDFVRERNEAYFRHEQEVRERKEQEPTGTVSWEEYCKMNGIEGRKSIFDVSTPTTKKQAKNETKESREDIYRIAKSLLTETNKTVLEAFGRVFERKYGCTIKDYIKKYENFR